MGIDKARYGGRYGLASRCSRKEKNGEEEEEEEGSILFFFFAAIKL